MNITSSIDENVTAMLKNNTNVNGVRTLEITLRIVATVASEVTCSGTIGGAVSIEFSISGTPVCVCMGPFSCNVDSMLGGEEHPSKRIMYNDTCTFVSV